MHKTNKVILLFQISLSTLISYVSFSRLTAVARLPIAASAALVLAGGLAIGLTSPSTNAATLQLPDLGGAGAGLVSPRQEYELGQKWIRLFRAQVRTSSDPFLQSYVENLIQQVAIYSDLPDKRLDVLVVENPSLNAFAVPGGVMGIHTGLFDYADNEDEFASVVAHELAHLSQRHFARRVVDQKEKSLPTMAAMLASILIAATQGADAGVAAISLTQAAALDAQLRFSRQMEQEADRIGMETLVRSGKNPSAMPAMFESMLHASRFSRRPPEFLLTHPLTESRVSDSILRAQKFEKKYYPQNSEYNLAKVRAALSHETNTQQAIKNFSHQLENSRSGSLAARYGLALALTKAGRLDEAREQVSVLRKQAPDNLYFLVAEAEVDSAAGDFVSAIQILKTALSSHPNSHPLNIRYAEVLMKSGNYQECEQILVAHSKRRPSDDYVWYLLAEVHGLAGNIRQVHTARAEYFMLNGLFDKAIIQLKNAKRLAGEDRHLNARIDLQLEEARKLREDVKL